ncbi:MAG: Na/Pi cotransporter family protein, partial [Clostridia bacterium]|nr:Na/Pi cotransporter family protein [Clostridia bacterium]
MTFDQTTIMQIILALGGLGLFLYGMRLMGEGLELAAGAKLRDILEKLTTNRFLGALVGVIVTAIIQSSTAVSVMCVGFVNASIMNISQAMGVIMGATIGTTVTSVLLSIQISDYAPLAIFIGAVMVMFMKKNNQKYIGQIIAGFGILFFGMTTMSSNLEPLASSDFFSTIITSVSNPFIGVIFGIFFAALLQSSSAAVGVLQALGAISALTLPNAVYMVYGIHIGACVTAVISAIGASKDAKRTALSYVLFTVFGTAIFTLLSLFTPFNAFIESVTDNIPFQISLVHILSSIIATLLILPAEGLIVKLSYIVIRGDEEGEKEACRLKYVDERLLQTPPIAVNQITKEIDRMGKLAKRN